MGLTRRAILRSAAAAALAASVPACGRRRVEGGFVGPSIDRGHRLRDGPPAGAPATREDVPVVVVGGGVAGLSAAWKLARSGYRDFLLLELEDDVGGTSVAGENAVSAYPWGAHYVPLPTREERALCELLLETGSIRGFDARGRAIGDEGHLVRAPEERVWAAGAWHEGLFPSDVATTEDLRQLERFTRLVDGLAARRDDAGRRAFAIPTARSARDQDLLALDRVSMAAWMAANGFDAPWLLWWVDYACRDDFGARAEATSAWAGLHYFAARIAVPGDEPAPFLTWPQGNGFLVRHLARAAGDRVRTGAVVLAVEGRDDRVVVRYADARRGTSHEVTADRVVCALPRHAARRVVKGLEAERGGFETSAWVVANVTLDGTPASRGFPTAWDNVRADSDSLGYVVATHQADRARLDTVWTWYHALCDAPPAQARRALLDSRWEDWRDRVLADLSPAHEDLERHVARIDVVRWGHAMPRPGPGTIWGPDRERAARPLGRVHFAGADLGGLPLFEEAQWSGVRAAEEVLAVLHRPFTSSL